jgi:phosphatidylethanolamine-binding protein (PEBP) family uncharacterized protein
MNSWKVTSYGGPKPPSGTHRYYFRLYALDITNTSANTLGELESMITSHSIGYA